jgi:hypothetical protein
MTLNIAAIRETEALKAEAVVLIERLRKYVEASDPHAMDYGDLGSLFKVRDELKDLLDFLALPDDVKRPIVKYHVRMVK